MSRYRVNYGQGQVWYCRSVSEAMRHIADMDLYREFAFIEARDRDTGN